jgi:hypothetical protein
MIPPTSNDNKKAPNIKLVAVLGSTGAAVVGIVARVKTRVKKNLRGFAHVLDFDILLSSRE